MCRPRAARKRVVRKERRRRPPHLSAVAIVYRAECRIRRGLAPGEADFPPASRVRGRRSPGLTLSSGFFLRGGGLISSGLDETQNDPMR